MKLKIDYREGKLKNLLDGEEFSLENLAIGDIEITDGTTTFIIERKTWQDLSSSIKDSRFREQRSRLLLWQNENINNKIMYFIEGKYDHNYKKEKLVTERLMIGYSIPVFYFSSLTEIKNFLIYIKNKENLLDFTKTRSIEEDQIEYRLSDRPKKKYCDAKLFLCEMIFSIHGITYEIAKNVTEPYDSICDFCKHFIDNKEEFISNIEKIQYKTKTGNLKKITKKQIEKIIKNLNFSI